MQSFAIVPAAGKSLRMGQKKLLLPLAGAAVIEHVFRAWNNSKVSRTVVVVRGDDRELIDVCRTARVELVVADSPPPEMKDSVRLGLHFIKQKFSPTDNDVWLLAPADMPELSPAVVDALLTAYVAEPHTILVPAIDGRRGHPVLFPWRLAAEVDGLGDDEGVNALLHRHSAREIDCRDASILHDLDDPDDYRRLQNRYDGK